jgi:hypothetical protein
VRMQGTPTFVLSIENLTTFHETLKACPQHTGWLLYTGGMPSPAWRRFYAEVLAAAPASTPIYHWGDIDQGGFRIAVVLQRDAATCRRTVLPWLMSPSLARRENPAAAFRPCSPSSAIARLCRAAGWDAVAAEFEHDTWEVEQEALRPQIPEVEGITR